MIDGCSGLRFLYSILMPMAKPTLVAFALISIVTHWNDFFWPLVVTDSPAVRTLTMGACHVCAARKRRRLDPTHGRYHLRDCTTDDLVS